MNALAAVNATPGPGCAMPGDMDCDDTVSESDFLSFESCMTGPGGGPVSGFCVCADLPGSPPDGDVDLLDFGAFQRSFTGYGEGACCHPDGTCTEGPVYDCPPDATYMGHGSTCAQITCEFQPYANIIEPVSGYVARGTTLGFADDLSLVGPAPREVIYYNLGVYGGGGGSFDVTASLYTGCPGAGGTLITGTTVTWTNVPDDGYSYILHADLDPVAISSTVWIVATFSTSGAGWLIAGEAETGFTANCFGVNVPPWGCNYVFVPPPDPPPHAGLWASLWCVRAGSLRTAPESSQRMTRLAPEAIAISPVAWAP